jgi:hypothetical protein
VPALTRLESDLRERARELIREGRLPDRAPARVWGGPGSGIACSLCEQAIPANEMEYEADAAVAGAVHTLHFHFVCHAAWQLECLRADFDARASAPGAKPPTAPRAGPRKSPYGKERTAIGWGLAGCGA